MQYKNNHDQKDRTGWIVGGVCILVIGIIFTIILSSGDKPKEVAESSTIDLENTESVTLPEGEAMVYKTPTCGCCGVYTKYLPGEGMKTKFTDLSQDQLDKMREKYKIPESMASCHITLVGNYFVSGHIPIEAIRKLNAEKPQIAGIALAGMPSGTPGMPGPKNESWVIYAVGNDGATSEFMTI